MTSEPRPHGEERASVLWQTIRGSYQRAFEAMPARAEAARNRSWETVRLLYAELGNAGLTPNQVRDGGLNDEELGRTLSWGAFDYSLERADGGGLEVVDAQILVVPPMTRLALNECDFPDMMNYIEECIIAMRIYRYDNASGPVVDNVNAGIRERLRSSYRSSSAPAWRVKRIGSPAANDT